MKIKNDFIAGFNVFLIALPLCLGIAIASNFPPTAGIMSAVIGGILTSFFSGSKLSIKGPAAGLIAITLASVDQLGGQDLLLGYERTLAVGVVAACLQMIIALGRKAVLAEIIPPSVIHGMLAAIGIIIVSKQSYVIMGLSPHSSNSIEQILHLPSAVSQLNPILFLIGLLAMIIIIFWPLIEKLACIPSSLMMLLLIIPLSLYLKLNVEHSYSFMGNSYSIGSFALINLPKDIFDAIHFPDFSYIFNPVSLKFILLFTLVGSIESLLTVFAIDSLTQQKATSNVNKDLLSVGIGNLFSALVGGLPMISEIVRSKANIDFGAKSEKANFFHGVFMLLAVIMLAKIINLIPLAALSALLIFVGVKLASPKEFIHAYKIGIDQFCVFIATFLLTLFCDLLMGVLAGIILKLNFHILRNHNLKIFFPEFLIKIEKDILYIVIKGPLIFLNYAKIISIITKNLNNNIKSLILDLNEVSYLDHTILYKIQMLKDKFSGINIIIKENPKLIPLYDHPLSSRIEEVKT